GRHAPPNRRTLDPKAPGGPRRRIQVGRQGCHRHHLTEGGRPAGRGVAVVACRSNNEDLRALLPLPITNDLQRGLDGDGRQVVVRLAAEGEIDDLCSVFRYRPDHLAGDSDLGGDAVAVNSSVDGDLRAWCDLLDDSGDEGAVAGMGIEVTIPTRQRKRVERV